MKYITIILLVSFSLISACGGGGGGGGGNGTNNPPKIEGQPTSFARAGETFSFTPAVSDVDGNQLTFSVSGLPDWAFFDAGSGSLTGYPKKINYGSSGEIEITVSDGSASASLTFSVDVLPPLLTKDNFASEGSVTETSDGYQSVGTLVMNIDGQEQRFEDSDLVLSFDEEGNLLDIAGETIVPQAVSDSLSLDAQVKATVGMMSGAEINSNPDFGITLKDELYFFVYYFSQSLDITVNERDGDGMQEPLTLSTPLGGSILFITDPNDVFYYYFADLPVIGNAGTGQSAHGFIPFIPDLDYAELSEFDGHIIDKLSFGLGVKIFDFFSLTGTRVINLPIPGEINYDDLFASPVDFGMGINGIADFDFSILGFGLFSFNLAETSATLEVTRDNQQMAMQTIIAPDVSWVPASFPFLPVSETVGEWFVNGDGSFSAGLSSTYKSTVPDAMLAGSMEIDNQNVVLTGTVGTGDQALGATATFFDTGVTVDVDVYADFGSGIETTVNTAFDDMSAELIQAFDDLQKATADFELELSLNGLRKSLPVIADNAIAVMNPYPQSVRNTVDTAIVNYVNNYPETCVLGICRNLLDDAVNETALGDKYGGQAKTTVTNGLASFKTAMTNLKNAANASDDIFRAAIKNALQQAYNARKYSKTLKYSQSISGLGTVTFYNKTVSRTILSTAIAADIKFALDNVDNIDITDGIKITAQQLYDSLPIEESINTAKQEVADGLAQIPTLDGVGYTTDAGVYSAYAILDGVQHEVFFNVLSPEDLAAGIGRLIADQML